MILHVTRSRFFLPAALLALAACSSGGEQDDSGPEDKVTFEGAEEKSESELREMIRSDVRRYEAERRPTALDDAAYRIEYQYRLDGFDRVKVTPRVDGENLVFKIEEGPQIRLGHVRFEGATVFRNEVLRELVPGKFLGDAPPYSLRLVLLIEDGLIAAYRVKGYADVAVTRRVSPEPDKNGRIHVWFTIDEGKPYHVTEIRGLPSDGKLLVKTGEYLGRPFTPGTGESLEATIIDHYRDNGHPFATARTRTTVDRDSGSVLFEADVRAGPGVRVGEKIIKGAVWSRSSFVDSRVDLSSGKEFRASELRRSEERLIATNVYKRVRVSPGPFQEESGTVPIEIDLEERETGEASLKGGYGSFEGIRLGADLTGIDIWGGAESVRVGGSFSKVGYRGDAELSIPYLFGTDLRGGFSAYYDSREYPSYDARSRGYVVSFSYPVFSTLSSAVGVRHAIIQTSNVDPNVPPGDLLDFNYTAVFLAPTLDLRDNALNPTQGILIASEFSTSPSTSLSDIQFWSASGRFSYYFPFPAGIVFATSFQGGIIAPIRDTGTIPISLREFAGGTNTVRGFKFEAIGPKVNGEPTGGEVFLAVQTDLRFPLWGSLQGALFTDVGGVWFERTRVNLSDHRYAVGVGLRFVTPAGALVADVGVNPHTLPGEHPIELHLSVGFPF
jgi:outer membrane protein assembly complex protein YaeT